MRSTTPRRSTNGIRSSRPRPHWSSRSSISPVRHAVRLAGVETRAVWASLRQSTRYSVAGIESRRAAA
jgi:hypothetical protein